jgi:SAM-dependent methyltransferase
VSSALAFYGSALREAARGRESDLDLVDPHSHRPVRRLALGEWCAGLRPGDHGVLDRCTGRSLDVGCGPGRLVAALTATGRTALGVDISAEAVRQARRRGAPAQQADIFAPVAGEGSWQHVLLADGNIGIGGDPYRLLHRCRELLAPGGEVIVEVDPQGARSWRGQVSIRHHGRMSHPFPWAAVAVDDLPDLAAAAAFTMSERWQQAQRWFARLVPAAAATRT